MPVINVYGSTGIIKDVPPHMLPPEAWTEGNNMRMVDGFMKRFSGHAQVLGTPSVAPGFVFFVPAANDKFWLYANLTAVHATDGTTHANITRGAGPYTATNFRDWNGCILGGVPILNNGNDVPQYWPTLSLAGDLANLTAWPATLRAKSIRNFGLHLVAMNLVDGGNVLSHALRWSHKADPGTVPTSWDVTNPAVDAGQTHLTDIQGGELLDGYLLFNYLVLYKQRSTHLMRFIGPPDVFGFELLFNSGLLNARSCAIIDLGVKHFCVSEDDVLVHAGTRNVDYPLNAKDRRYLFNDMDASSRVNAFAFDNPFNEEAWFAYPSSGATIPNKALVWNYRTGLPKFRDFPGISADVGSLPTSAGAAWDSVVGSWDNMVGPWNAEGERRIVVADPTNTKLWGLDTGFTFGTSTVTAYVQRTGWAIVGKDRFGQPKADFNVRKLFKRIWPKLRGSAVVQVRLGSQEEFDGPVTWAPYQTFDPVRKFLDFKVNGRFGAIEISTTSNADLQVDGFDIEVVPLGAH